MQDENVDTHTFGLRVYARADMREEFSINELFTLYLI